MTISHSGLLFLGHPVNGSDSMVQCLTGLNLICQIVCFRLNAQINSLNPVMAPMEFHKALYLDHYFFHCTLLLLVHWFLPSLSITICMLMTLSWSYLSRRLT